MKFKFEKLHIYTLALIGLILPNIVFLNTIPQPLDSIYYIAFPKGEMNFDFFSYGKMLFLVFSTVFLSLVFLLNRAKKIKWNNSYYFLLGYTFFIILSTIQSPFKDLAIRGLGDRYEGVFVLIAYLILFFVAFDATKEKEDRQIILAGIIGGSVIVGLIGIFQYWGFDIFRTKFGQNIITPEKFHNFKFNFTFGKYTIYSTLYNTNFVGSYMVLMLFLAVGLFLNSSTKKEKIWSYLYALLMFSNWIGCRSRAGLLGGGIVVIFSFLLFNKQIKSYKKQLVILISSFAIVFVIMNTVKTEEQGNLAEKFTTLGGGKTDLRDVYTENELLIIRDNYCVLKLYQKDGKVKFFNEKNEVLNPSIKREKAFMIDKNNNKTEILINKISLNEEKYSRFSFNILAQGVLELEYNEGRFNKNGTPNNVKYPIYLIGNKYNSVGVNGKIFEIVSIPRLTILDGYERFGSSRGYIWSKSVPLLKDTLFLGYGPDTFSLVFPQNDTFGKTIAFGMGNMIVDKPHNMYVQIGVNTGVISMILFIIGIFIFFLDGIVKYRKSEKLDVEKFLWLGTLAYFVTALFNDSLISVAPIAWIYFGISAGLIYNQNCEEKFKN